MRTGLARAQAAMRRAGRAMATAGAKLSRTLSVALGLIGGIAIKMAIDFEFSMSKIVGQVGIASKTVQAMKKDVLALSGATGRAPKELADAMFFVTSAGLRGAAALEVLTTSAKAASAGFGETKIVADLLTSAVNAYGEANLSAAEAGDILAATVREGKREAAEIASTFGFVLPISSELGVSFNEVGSAIAAMSRTGTGASTAVIQLRQILFSILKPSQQAEQAFKDMGTSSARLRAVLAEEGGLLRLLEFLREETKTNSQAFAQAFPNIRALAGALDIMGKNAKVNAGIFKRMRDNTGDMDRAAKAAAVTMRFFLNQAMAELKIIAIDVGNILFPVFRKLVGFIKDIARGFGAMTSANKKATLALAALGFAAGPVIFVLGKLLLVIVALTAPITLVIIGMIGLIAVFALFQHNSELALFNLRNSFKRLHNDIVDVKEVILNGLVKAFGKLIDAINIFRIHLNLVPLDNPIKGLVVDLSHMREEIEDSGIEFVSWSDIWVKGIAKMKKALAGLFPEGGPLSAGLGEIDVTPSGRTRGRGGAKTSIRNPFQLPVFNVLLARIISIRSNLAEFRETMLNVEAVMQSVLIPAFSDLGTLLGNLFIGDSGAKSFFDGLLLIVASFMKTFGQALIAAGVASKAFKELLLKNPIAAIGAGIALIAASAIVRGIIKKGPGGVQGLDSGGFVTRGGVFQLHRDELVNLPRGSAVTPARQASGMSGGSLSTKISLRKLIIELDKERERMGR